MGVEALAVQLHGVALVCSAASEWEPLGLELPEWEPLELESMEPGLTPLGLEPAELGLIPLGLELPEWEPLGLACTVYISRKRVERQVYMPGNILDNLDGLFYSNLPNSQAIGTSDIILDSSLLQTHIPVYLDRQMN
jgi:hypothetical protein